MENGQRYWYSTFAALILAVVVGVYAYNAGVAHGIEQSAKIVIAPAPGGVAPAPYYPYYGHPWGSGFVFGPIFFIFFCMFILRSVFGGGRWSRGYCGSFSEWHRREHEQMNGERPARS